jgi:hypothetical protein
MQNNLSVEEIGQQLAAMGPQVREGIDGSYTTTIIHEPAGEAGSITFKFQEIERTKRTEFDSYVDVIIHEGTDIFEYSSRLNLASMSSREAFIRALQRIGGKKPYDAYLSKAISAITKKLDAIPKAVRVTELPAWEGAKYLFWPFVTDKSANLIFGDGGSNKSYICIQIAVAIATNTPFAGFTPGRKASVLYLDYEDDASKFNDRVMRVVSGMPTSPTLEDLWNIMHMKPNGLSLPDLKHQLKEIIKKNNIELLIVDSVAYACGAEIEKADAVIKYFNALDSLGIASLGIGHITKGSADAEKRINGQQHAIGSIFFNNGPRNIWNAVKLGDENERESVKKVCLFHRKCNDASLERPVPLEVDFSRENIVTIRKGDERDWQEAESLGDRIIRYIKSGKPTDRKSIDQEFEDVPMNTLKITLKRLKTAGKIIQPGGFKGDYMLVKK